MFVHIQPPIVLTVEDVPLIEQIIRDGASALKEAGDVYISAAHNAITFDTYSEDRKRTRRFMPVVWRDPDVPQRDEVFEAVHQYVTNYGPTRTCVMFSTDTPIHLTRNPAGLLEDKYKCRIPWLYMGEDIHNGKVVHRYSLMVSNLVCIKMATEEQGVLSMKISGSDMALQHVAGGEIILAASELGAQMTHKLWDKPKPSTDSMMMMVEYHSSHDQIEAMHVLTASLQGIMCGPALGLCVHYPIALPTSSVAASGQTDDE